MIDSSWIMSVNEFPIANKHQYDGNDLMNFTSERTQQEQEQNLFFALYTEINSVVLSKHSDTATETMIPAQYFQQITLGKRQFFREVQMLPILETLGCRLSLHSQTIRFRKNLYAFETYKMIIRIAGWNDNDFSFVLEILFVNSETCDVCAVHYSRYFIVANFDANRGSIDKTVSLLSPYELFSKVVASKDSLPSYQSIPSDPVRTVSLESSSSVESFQSTSSISSITTTSSASSLMSEEEKNSLMREKSEIIVSPIAVFWED
jgi:hypothetical protein